MDQVAVCRGDRGGICYHVYDGYYYRSDGNNERPHKYLHCTTNGCPGRAVMPSRIEDRTVNNFKMTTLHDHAPSLTSLYINNLKESILARCESEFTSLKQIFDEEMAKAPKEIHGLLKFQNFKTTMSRTRRSIKVSLLNVLQDDIADSVSSETENMDCILSAEDGDELIDLQDQPKIAINCKRKKISEPKSHIKAHTLPKKIAKKLKSCNDEEQFALETKWIKREEEPESTLIDENNFEHDYEEMSEEYFKDEEVHFESQKEHFEDENVNNFGDQFFEKVDVFDDASKGSLEDKNNYDVFDGKHGFEILTSEDIVSEKLKQSPDSKITNLKTVNIQGKYSYSHTESAENISEDLHKYLKINTQPSSLNCQHNDLLSIFFKEMEATVRSFLPSIIIEAKGKIANLVNRLEMRNWQVQKKLHRRKQLEQQLEESKQKEVLQMQKQQLDQQLQRQQQEHQLTPEQQFKELQKKQQEILKQQQEILEKNKHQLNNQQVQWHQRAKSQQERLEKLYQQEEMQKNKKQEYQRLELTQANYQQAHGQQKENQQENQGHNFEPETQQNIQSQPVVIQYNPKVSLVYLSDQNLASSTPKINISKLTRVQDNELGT